MEYKISGLALSLLMLISVLAIPMVMGYDASNPYTVALNWIVPSDTTFTVALVGNQTTIIFEPTNKSSLEVMPNDQTDVTPILTFTNQGNVVANYSMVVSGFLPPWATLKGYDSYAYGSATTIGNTTTVTLKDSVAVSDTAELWLWTDFNNAVSGTNASSFEVSAVAS